MAWEEEPKGGCIRILVLEDDDAFSSLLEEWLSDLAVIAPHLAVSTLQVVVCARLADALDALRAGRFDILLVDLNLPDSQGMETFDRLFADSSELPVIVLSAMVDESLAIQAVRRGAQDYLVKGRLDGELLIRSIRYAIERSLLQQKLLRSSEDERHIRERRALDRFLSQGFSAVSSRMLGQRSLKQGVPELFDEHVSLFAQSLERAVEARTHKSSYDPSPEMKEMANGLGFLKCGPRDVVDIYLDAVDAKSIVAYPKKRQVYGEEGRLLALELMGYLVSYYRPYALSAREKITS
ncbi:MAG: response regulator [Magnetococcales bacterium]|nr:response regulator [Magnetococcales bacterium]